MQEKDIKKELKAKHEAFIESLYWQETKDLVRAKTFFAGGCIRDMIRGKEPKDYDLYFYDQESVNKFKELAKKEFSLKETLIHNFNSRSHKFQLITILCGMPESLTKNFDFTVNTGYYCPQLDTIKIGELSNVLYALPDTKSPFNALVRALQFVERGYALPAETIVKLGVQINHMNKIDTDEDLSNALKGISTSFTLQGKITMENHNSNDFSFDDIPF